jgi:hypothetical protein
MTRINAPVNGVLTCAIFWRTVLSVTTPSAPRLGDDMAETTSGALKGPPADLLPKEMAQLAIVLCVAIKTQEPVRLVVADESGRKRSFEVTAREVREENEGQEQLFPSRVASNV